MIVLPIWNIPVELLVILGDVSIIPVPLASPITRGVSNAVASVTISLGITS